MFCVRSDAAPLRLFLRSNPALDAGIMKGQQAFGEVTHALMRKHNPYRP